MFNQKQINKILSNKNVDKCSSTSITYNKEFKLQAVKQYYEDGYSPSMIFKAAEFDLNIVGKSRPKECLKTWKRTYNKGKGALGKENRGGPGRKPKMKFKNKDEEIKYLKTKIEYLDTENDFLAKLRGLKRE